jgi:hypothetical protein
MNALAAGLVQPTIEAWDFSLVGDAHPTIGPDVASHQRWALPTAGGHFFGASKLKSHERISAIVDAIAS